MNLSKRSYATELLDRHDIPFAEIRQNLIELDLINTYLGGHSATINGFRSLSRQLRQQSNRTIHVCEIGCGGGDNLRVIKEYCARKNIEVELTGIDINEYCIDYARSRKQNEDIAFIASDYKLVVFKQKPDIIFCSLFTHHFTDDEVIAIFDWMKSNCNYGFFVNDLHRHPFAYTSIRLLTKWFSKSRLVKNDAPLSVLRGFRKSELLSLLGGCRTSGQPGVVSRLKWRWAFRWLLIVQ